MNDNNIQKMLTTQKYFLLIVTIFLLVTTPQFWIIAPDSGYYIGTAQAIVSSFEYNFNYLPNILYYPGISALLAIPLSVTGENFWVLQFYFAVISVFAVWLSKNYFSYKGYGVVGLLTPIFLILCSKYLFHLHALLSDTVFLTFTLLCLVCWKKYETTQVKKYLWWCICLAAFCSLIRFQGVFLCAALSLSLFVQFIFSDKQNRKKAFYLTCIATFIVFFPFLLWTIRNYFAHSADAFTMANTSFFGLKGLRLYVSGLAGNIDSTWIDSTWKATAYRFVFFFGGLAEFWVGSLSTNQKAIFTLILLPIISLGSLPWFKRATTLERIYIIMSVLFIVKGFFGGKSIYVVTRYWIPLLPFVIICIGFGVQSITNFFKANKIKKSLQVTAALTACSIVAISLPNLANHIKTKDKYAKISKTLNAVKEFAATSIPKDSKVSTMEWGIMPHTIGRQSFPVLNDPSYRQTIDRITKYQVEYLVIDNFSRNSEISTEMTEQYPHIFKLVFETDAAGKEPQAKIYTINLLELDNLP